MAGEAGNGNGFAALRRDVDGLLKWKEIVQGEGCPHHKDIRREISEMKRIGGWIIGLQLVTLIGVTAAAIMLYLRATGHG